MLTLRSNSHAVRFLWRGIAVHNSTLQSHAPNWGCRIGVAHVTYCFFLSALWCRYGGFARIRASANRTNQGYFCTGQERGACAGSNAATERAEV